MVNSRKRIEESFQEIARKQPDSTAVVDGAESLTYAELDSRSGDVARALVRRGVGRGDLVGLATVKSADLIVCMLGVLKSGAAYLPLDPAYPAERLAYLVRDGRPVCVVVDDASSLPLGPDVRAVRRGELTAPRADDGSGYGDAEATGEDAAYVIHTSGSTGEPKGVAVAHSSVTALLEATRGSFAFGPRDVWTFFHSQCFDFSVWEIWGPLLTGGRVVVVPYGVSSSPADFLRLLREERVTVLSQTPSAFHLLSETAAADPSAVRGLALRHVVFGGEPLDFSRLRTWRRVAGGDAAFVNMYGITETTVHTTLHVVTPEETEGGTGGSVIGPALPHLTVHLLDDKLAPVAPGETGEMYVSGAGVALGYLGRPELTAARFIACPFAPGERMYRSGDLARLRPDGELEYVGRSDDQVKVRGFRIEPGEIEQALAAHPGVDRAAVVKQEAAGGSSLVAYVTLAASEGAAPGEEADRVGEWHSVYQEMYSGLDALESVGNGDADADADETAAFAGWNRSWDQRPIPVEEMREWQAGTVRRILGLDPARVLEIGVGSGLLVTEIAPKCTEYWGTDLSESAVERLRARFAEAEGGTAAVTRLSAQPAHDFTGIPEGAFDVVVINSVAQYFPSGGYLDRVVEGALRRLVPGGFLFVGDVRNLALHRHFAAETVGLRHGEGALTAGEARRLVAAETARDGELLVDPRYFTRMSGPESDVDGVAVLLKAESTDNELSRYRYDVVLRKAGPERAAGDAAVVLRWGRDCRDLGELRDRLDESRSTHAAVRVVGVPNRRIARGASWLAALDGGSTAWPPPAHPEPAGSGEHAPGYDPAELRALGSRAGYDASAAWSEEADRFDLVLSPPGRRGLTHTPPSVADGERLTSEPMRSGPALRRYGAAVRGWLRERLPAHMVPSAVVPVDDFPLTANGKLDKRALAERHAAAAEFDVPVAVRAGDGNGGGGADGAGAGAADGAGDVAVLARIVADILGLPRVPVAGTFLDAGGDSLSAARVVNRVRTELDADLSVRTLIEPRSLSEVAASVRTAPRARPRITPRADAPRSEPERHPLSAAQRNLWFNERVAGATSAYNVPVCFDLTGDVDGGRLAAAFRRAVSATDLLRSRYVTGDDGAPARETLPPGEVCGGLVREVTLHGGESLDDVTAREAARPFRLETDGPARLVLVRHGGDGLRALLVFHHIAVDGWSVRPFLDRLAACYAATESGAGPAPEPAPEPAPPPGPRYADYQRWRDVLLGTEEQPTPLRSEQTRYWREQLAGTAPLLALPTDHPRPPVFDGRGARHRVVIGAATVRRIRELSRERDCTVFMLVQAALGVLLARMTGATDVPVGVAVSGRDDPALQRAVGSFANTVVLRLDLDGDPSFTELLGRVAESSLRAYQHQELPFDSVVNALNPDRSLSHHPVYQVLSTFQDAAAERLELPGAEARWVPVDTGGARFDLAFDFTPRDGADGEEIALSVEYPLALFEPETVRAVGDRFLLVLDALLSAPGRPVLDGDVLLPRERETYAALCTAETSEREPGPERERQRDGETAGTAGSAGAAGTTGGTAFHRFRRRALAHPDRTAVVADDASVTYGALLERATAIGAHLAASGTGEGDLVALLLKRSPDLPAAMLGVMASGAAYLPLDPANPPGRIADVLRMSEPGLILADTGHGALPESLRERVVDLGESTPGGPEPAGPELAGPGPDTSAYVIYTSGSTGVPKGVDVTHRSLADFLSGMGEVLGTGPDDTYLATTSAAFDPSLVELLLPLLHGARVAMPPAGVAGTPDRLGAAAARLRPTLMQGTPTMWQALREYGWTPPCPMTLLCGGEALTDGLADHLARTGARAFNLYGPTETTVWSTAHRLTPGGRPELGRPLPRNRLHVLDRRLRPVPPGTTGEIHISGTGLARGYRSRADLTAARYVADPHGAPGARLYRTGDLAKWTRDGGLHFLGRNDDQVKLRGHRIELGEVKARLLAHDAVDTGEVVVKDTPSGGRVLVAYAVPVAEPPEEAELKEHLRAALPEYMVPSAVVVLGGLPLNPNGKVDRAALPYDAFPETARALPATAGEAALAEVFADVLGVPAGVTDDFFDAGGNSVSAVRLCTLAARRGYACTPADVFAGRTVRGVLAALADREGPDGRGGREGRGDRRPDGALEFHPGASRPVLCFYPKEGVGWHFANLARELGEDVSVRAFQSPLLAAEPDGPLPASVEDVAAAHAAPLLAGGDRGPHHLVGWSFGGLLAYETARLLVGGGHRIGSLTVLDIAPFEGEPPPLPRELHEELAAVRRERPDDVQAAPMIRLHELMAERYRPVAAPLPPPAAVTYVSSRETADPAAAARAWQRLTGAAPQTVRLDAAHNALLRPESAGHLAAVVHAHLARTAEQHPAKPELEQEQEDH